MKRDKKTIKLKNNNLFILIAIVAILILFFIFNNLIISSDEKAAISQYVEVNLLSDTLIETLTSYDNFSDDLKTYYAIEYAKENFSYSVNSSTIASVYKNLFNEDLNIYRLPPEYNDDQLQSNDNSHLLEQIDMFIKDSSSVNTEELKNLIISSNIENENIIFEPYAFEINKISKSLSGTYKIKFSSHKLNKIEDFINYYKDNTEVQSQIYDIQNSRTFPLLKQFLNDDNFENLTTKSGNYQLDIKLVDGRFIIKDFKTL